MRGGESEDLANCGPHFPGGFEPAARLNDAKGRQNLS
jgi:hypothetical protein